MTFITAQEQDDLYDLAIDAGLQDPQYRASLLRNIDPRAAGFIPIIGAPMLQLRTDIAWMLDHPRLSDGSVPLLTWLKNAASLRRPFADGAKFRTLADRVSSAAAGEPPVVITAPASPNDAPVLSVGGKSIAAPELKE